MKEQAPQRAFTAVVSTYDVPYLQYEAWEQYDLSKQFLDPQTAAEHENAARDYIDIAMQITGLSDTPFEEAQIELESADKLARLLHAQKLRQINESRIRSDSMSILDN